MKKTYLYLVITLFLCNSLYSQYNGNNIAISTNYSFNTTAKIFLTPNAENIVEQNYNFGIEDINSYSVELRYRLNEDIILGFSAEYMEASGKGRNLNSREFVVKDGFELYPFEFSVYYYLPFSIERYKFYMGGGFGFYSGKRTREFGDIKFTDVDSEIGYGIQVSAGMDYIIFDNLSVRGELRFRDPDFKITNKYNSNFVNYNGSRYSVTTDDIPSKINMDGITFRIGAVFNFSI